MDAVVLPKRWYSSASTHGIRNKKVIIKIFTAMRTVNIIQNQFFAQASLVGAPPWKSVLWRGLDHSTYLQN
jgi:hypothetical protein